MTSKEIGLSSSVMRQKNQSLRPLVNASAQSSRKEIGHRSFEFVGLFYVRHVSRQGYFDQLSVWQILNRFAPQHGPIAERFYRFGGGIAAEEYAAIALADDEQHRHFEQRVFLPVWLLEHHLVGKGRCHRPPRIFGAQKHSRKNVDIVLCGRRPTDEEALHEGVVALGRLRHLGLKERLDRLWCDSAAVVFKT